MVRSGQRVQIYDWVVSSPGAHSPRWATCEVVHRGCSDLRGDSTMVAGVHRGQRSGPVSNDIALSNHAVQRTPGACILRDEGPISGGAPGAADGERYACRRHVST